jgi:hypothetical protein
MQTCSLFWLAKVQDRERGRAPVGSCPSVSLLTEWFSDRTASGLSSGEGLIDNVRDAVVKWNPKEGREETADPGIKDKRLLVTEEEFAGALSVMERHGNTLSAVIRSAWDGQKLQTLTKSSPLKATGAHVSLIGHKDELHAKLTRTDMANGLANRFLFPLVRRSKHLPHGGHFPDTELEKFGKLIDERRDGGLGLLRRVGCTDFRGQPR